MVTGIRRRADDWIASYAGPRLARVDLRARVLIVTGGTVRPRRSILASSRCRIAGPRIVTGIRRRADDRIASYAGPRLARVDLCARVPIVAGGSVRLRRSIPARSR